MITQRSEYVSKLSGFGGGIAHTISRKQRKLQRDSDFNCSTVAKFLFAAEVPLELDINILSPENVNETFDGISRRLDSAIS